MQLSTSCVQFQQIFLRPLFFQQVGETEVIRVCERYGFLSANKQILKMQQCIHWGIVMLLLLQNSTIRTWQLPHCWATALARSPAETPTLLMKRLGLRRIRLARKFTVVLPLEIRRFLIQLLRTLRLYKKASYVNEDWVQTLSKLKEFVTCLHLHTITLLIACCQRRHSSFKLCAQFRIYQIGFHETSDNWNIVFLGSTD